MNKPRHREDRESTHDAAPRKRRWGLVAGIGVFILFILFAHTPLIIPVHSENGVFLASTYQLREDDPSLLRLQELRRHEHLDSVVAGGKTEFEKIVLLRGWVHKQWQPSIPFHYPPWDAAEILDLARSGKSRGFCAQYAIVFLQVCQSMGIHARYVDLPGHFVVGVWSDDFDKWVLMDPMNDIHFEKDGIPLTGRQLCEAYWKNALNGVDQVKSDGSRGATSRDDLNVYRMYSIVRAADQLSHPIQLSINGVTGPLRHDADYQHYPVVGRDKVGFGAPFLAWKEKDAKEQFAGKELSDDPDDFTYKMNQTLIFLARKNPAHGLAKVMLVSENAPDFREFECRLNGGAPRSTSMREVFWNLSPGMNELDAQVETASGWRGPVSKYTVYYKPDWLSKYL